MMITGSICRCHVSTPKLLPVTCTRDTIDRGLAREYDVACFASGCKPSCSPRPTQERPRRAVRRSDSRRRAQWLGRRELPCLVCVSCEFALPTAAPAPAAGCLFAEGGEEGGGAGEETPPRRSSRDGRDHSGSVAPCNCAMDANVVHCYICACDHGCIGYGGVIDLWWGVRPHPFPLHYCTVQGFTSLVPPTC